MELVEATTQKKPLWVNDSQVGVKNVLSKYVKGDTLDFKFLRLYKHRLVRTERIILFGAGESFSVALAGKSCLDSMTDIVVSAYPSSELMRSKTYIDNDCILIAVSTTGEDVETIYATKRAMSLGARVIAICPILDSSLSKIADKVVSPSPTAKTTSFASSYLTLCLLSIYIGDKMGVISPLYQSVVLKMAELLSGKIYSATRENNYFDNILRAINESDGVFACGMGVDYAVALDSSIALQKIGINAIPNYLGEIINYDLENKTVLAFISSKDRLSETISYLNFARQNGAGIFVFTTDNIAEEITDFSGVVAFSDLISLLNPIIISSGVKKLIDYN